MNACSIFAIPVIIIATIAGFSFMIWYSNNYGYGKIISEQKEKIRKDYLNLMQGLDELEKFEKEIGLSKEDNFVEEQRAMLNKVFNIN